MNRAEEDALVASCLKPDSPEYSLTFNRITDPENIRLAIRAAVAHERERAARVCEEQEARWYRTKFQHIAKRCAAAIRRGE